jgi:AcrR family transcriptional regulator
MKSRSRRERDKEKMRRMILDAAKQLFVKEGFENVSMRRIASAIEYSPAALYRYFKNKREILSTIRDEGFRAFVEGQKKRHTRICSPLERLKDGGREYIRFAMRDPDIFYLMFCTTCQEVDLEGELACNADESFILFKQSVADCINEGVFGKSDQETVVFALWAAVHGLSHLINTGRVSALVEEGTVDSLIERVLDFHLRPFLVRETGEQA